MTPTFLAVSRVSGTQFMASGRVRMQLVVLDNHKQIGPADTFTHAALLMRSSK